MQTIMLKVNENYLQTILSILQSFKEGMIEDLSVIKYESKKVENNDIDTFFDKFQIDMSNYKFNRDEANER
jgi:hypothetical protein